jgi:hypothetical protein
MVDELYTSVIQLDALTSIGLLVLCLFLVFRGRPEIATGIYLAGSSCCIVLKIGNIAQTWILLATMFGAAFVFYNKNNNFRFPKNDRWIIPWVSFWWIWSLVLLFFSGTSENKSLIQAFILGTILPIPVVLVYSQKIKSIESFSIAYIFITMIGGLMLLHYINVNYPVLMINPLTGAYGIGRLPIRNYHTFAYVYGISIIMLIALLQLTKNLLVRVLYICAIVYCLYFVYFSNSRQTIFTTLIVCILFLFWLFSKKYVELKGLKHNIKKIRILLILAVITFMAYFLYESLPSVILRDAQIGDADSVFGAGRVESWLRAIQLISDSYFIGTVYEAGNVHNLFLSVLANEGIVGFILLLGFLLFFFKQIRNIWSVKKINNVAIWRMAFCCIFLFTIIHSQFSGDNISAPELFWSAIFLWYSNKYSNVIQLKFNQ